MDAVRVVYELQKNRHMLINEAFISKDVPGMLRVVVIGPSYPHAIITTNSGSDSYPERGFYDVGGAMEEVDDMCRKGVEQFHYKKIEAKR